MMQGMSVQTVVEKLKTFNPYSVFLYGSRTRGDALVSSDYEVGVLFKKDHYVSRSVIQKSFHDGRVNVYPFVLEDFLAHRIDTPFQTALFLREIALSGQTIFGEKVVEATSPPPIKTLDLLQDIRFDLGRALAAVLSYRNDDVPGAETGFSKSCLYGLRCLIILKNAAFPITYEQIFQSGLPLIERGHHQLAEAALGIRQGKPLEDQDLLYQNISFLNQIVESSIVDHYKSAGDVVILK